jgi:type IV secretory pathway ATPase VirB11/archaellum biosynthesis ATPase
MLGYGSTDEDDDCRCEPSFEDGIGAVTAPDGGVGRLVVDADDCPGAGRLAAEPACRATVVGALRERDAESVRTRAAGLDRVYEDRPAALLVAAGRFAERVAFRDEALATRAERDPLLAARQAAGRAGPVADLVAETGLVEVASAADGYEDALRPSVAPTVADARVRERPPEDATLVDRYDLPTDAIVRIYERPAAERRTYHLTPVELTFDPGGTRTLAAAADRLAMRATGGDRALGRAVRAVADADAPVATLTRVLAKHTRGLGVLADLFADDRVTDAFAPAPVHDNPVHVRVDGAAMRTNVRLTEPAAEALASRFRRESGRAFSRAAPTLDAQVETDGRGVRVAGVTEPVSDGHGFAFRAADRDPFRLPELVDRGTVTPSAAGLLSLATEAGAATLVAGGRGAGKTTLLGALLPELPAATRTVVIEDTPELPVQRLQTAGRDVQRLRVDRGGDGVGPQEALRTALRLGEGALVVGEVRGAEAGVLYEAMRVGAADATLGTIHGSDAAAVRERVVTDLGVAESAFAATDLVVTLDRVDGRRRVTGIEEVVGSETVEFAPLFDTGADGLDATGRIDRGNSQLVTILATPGETYADVRTALRRRRERFRDG